MLNQSKPLFPRDTLVVSALKKSSSSQMATVHYETNRICSHPKAFESDTSPDVIPSQRDPRIVGIVEGH